MTKNSESLLTSLAAKASLNSTPEVKPLPANETLESEPVTLASSKSATAEKTMNENSASAQHAAIPTNSRMSAPQSTLNSLLITIIFSDFSPPPRENSYVAQVPR